MAEQRFRSIPRAGYALRWGLRLAAAALLSDIGIAHAQSGSITGTLRLIGCSAQPSDVTVSAGAKKSSTERDPTNSSALRYRISGLAKGQYDVVPRLASGTCTGGTWNPLLRNVRLNAAQSVTSQDFEYRLQRRTKRISGTTFAALVEQLFRGTIVHLNNYGPRHEDTWQKADDSFIRLGPSLGGGELRFDIPELRGPGGRRYYFSDLSLSHVSASPHTGRIKLVVELEKRGTAMKGRCVDDIACFDAMGDAAPDFPVDNVRLELELVPARDPGGGIAYGPVRAMFFANINRNGSGEVLQAMIDSQIKTTIEAVARQTFDQKDLHDRVAAALQPTLETMQIASIIGVRMEGTDLVIDYPAQ